MGEFEGTWACVSEYESSTVISIARTASTDPKAQYSVSVIDSSDSEEAKVYDVSYENDTLKFAAYWSTGQLTLYKLRMEGGKLEVVFTYTDRTYYLRVETD